MISSSADNSVHSRVSGEIVRVFPVTAVPGPPSATTTDTLDKPCASSTSVRPHQTALKNSSYKGSLHSPCPWPWEMDLQRQNLPAEPAQWRLAKWETTTENIMQLGAMPLRLCVWLEGNLMFSHTTNPISSWDGCNFHSHLLLQIQTLKTNIQKSKVLHQVGFSTSFCVLWNLCIRESLCI